jgi:glycine hydroxymethyltransferase
MDKAQPLNGSAFVYSGPLSEIDADVTGLIEREERRQAEKLIMIPSESICPLPVREVMKSCFGNLYAEGLPSIRVSRDERHMLPDTDRYVAFHRRYGDRRFYKGCEFINIIEALAQKRAAELFATPDFPADKIFVNVQPLSGAAANNAVYEAFTKPGDTVMGMSLSHGGHLTHGSQFNRSGRHYKIVSYEIDCSTGVINYEHMKKVALEVRPRMIIAGASSYPWTIDWKQMREAADSVGALLLADISHPAGLVAAGVFPSPVGIADAVTMTTHKTLLGPRGAIILSTNEDLAKKIDNAVFPGEQGGPHVHQIAAKATSFLLDNSDGFRQTMRKVVENCKALADSLKKRGIPLVYGGTDTHLLVIDLNGIKTKSGIPMKGDVAANILDLCGITANKNTIPGDSSAADASGIRFGTVWLTQRGMGPAQMDKIAEMTFEILSNISTFRISTGGGIRGRGRIDRRIMDKVRSDVTTLISSFPDPTIVRPAPAVTQKVAVNVQGVPMEVFEVRGERARMFLQNVATANVLSLEPGKCLKSLFLDGSGTVVSEAAVLRIQKDDAGYDRFIVAAPGGQKWALKNWFQALSDGYALFDPSEVSMKIDGPVEIGDVKSADVDRHIGADSEMLKLLRNKSGLSSGQTASVVAKNDFGKSASDTAKPYFIGQSSLCMAMSATVLLREKFRFAKTGEPPKRSPLYQHHLKLKGKMVPFAGWDMPVWYTSISAEHDAVRKTAGLFDVSHMGVLGFDGEDSARFLDLLTSNFAHKLRPGQSHYAYLCDSDGGILDDLFIYRLGWERFLVVVNAANDDKDKAWIRGVIDGKYVIDNDNTSAKIDARNFKYSDLRDPVHGDRCRVDIALQGPVSRDVLLKIVATENREAMKRLHKNELFEGKLAGLPVIVSHTGYTGEDVGFELFVHPQSAGKLWDAIMEAGTPLGMKPTGLGARDSTRTEAGFPLYGHELAGQWNITPAEAGYGSFVRHHKPFFIGRKPLLDRQNASKMQSVRFKMVEKGIRTVKPGDPVVDKRGAYIGVVTSCALIEGAQLGLAYVDKSYAEENTRLRVFILPKDDAGLAFKPARQLAVGDKVQLTEDAVVLSRFRAK